MSVDLVPIDPVTELEARVDAIVLEHQAFWGCDDPVCAVASSNLMRELAPRPKSRWQRFKEWLEWG